MTFTSTQWVQWLLNQDVFATKPADTKAQIIPLGQLLLSSGQMQAALRLNTILMTYNGAILADAVGTGKTRTALACAVMWKKQTQDHRPILCCVPSRLIGDWKEACALAKIEEDVLFVSHATMSTQTTLAIDPCLLIVDEAHHMRNPQAIRSQTLALWAMNRHVLMLTATPVCNSVWDMYHLLRVFLGEDDLRQRHGLVLHQAFEQAALGQLDITTMLSSCVIRASDRQVGATRPDVRLEYLSYKAQPNARWLWRHLESHLRDVSWSIVKSQWPQALCIEHLIQCWESGPQALANALDALIDYHQRWIEAAQRGVTLSRKTHQLLFDQDIRQQAILPFVWDDLTSTCVDTNVILQATQDLTALVLLRQRLDALLTEGCGRIRAIVSFMKREPNPKLLLFTRFESTAQHVFTCLTRALGTRAQIGLVTGSGAWATGLERTTPGDVLRRFAPVSQGIKPMKNHQRLRVLIATDCLAEGVNLQDCGCVVMLDLPYSPLGVEQRVGRLVRPGGPHLNVRVLMPRPDSWHDSLGLRRRLAQKGVQAQHIGVGLPLSQALFHTEKSASRADRPLEAHDMLQQLRSSVARQGVPNLQGWWVSSGKETLCFLACACLSWGDQKQLVWLCEKPGAPLLEQRPGVIVPLLIHAIDQNTPIKEAPWPVNVCERMTTTLNTLVETRQIIAQAPGVLGRDTVNWTVWTSLRDSIQQQEGGWLRWSSALSQLKPRLLRTHPVGVGLWLTQWLSDHPDWSIAQMVYALDQNLPKLNPHNKQLDNAMRDLSWSWVGGLWIRA